MYYTDDPARDFLNYDAEQCERLKRLPVCCECEKPIQSETCYEFNGEYICPKCLEENHRQWVENLID